VINIPALIVNIPFLKVEELGPGASFTPADHDAWVVGDQDVEGIDVTHAH
jgi:hypothetical protein